MDAPNSPHPDDRTLNDYGRGKLDDEMASSVNDHLEACPDCRGRVAGFTPDSFLGRFREARQPSVGGTSDRTMDDVGMSGLDRAGRLSVPLPADAPGKSLADHPDYEIRRELGRGGMGVVYLAHNRLMARDEVLKIVGSHLVGRKGIIDRFTREIRSAARLSHPNIVHAYSAFRSGPHVVFAMEYVDGLDLAKLVRSRGPLPVAHACSYIHQAALGLQHAHEQSMVHRDIKPGNLMLARKGGRAVVKVLDFGLARASRENSLDGGLTIEGQMLGTPDFIAPEQIRDAQSADIRADIYSLGCTLYYLLTGAPPFQAALPYDVLQAHFSMDAQPLNLVRPEVPADLAALVSRMMAKEAGHRFQTPGEVAQALTPFFRKTSAASKPELTAHGEPAPRRAGVAAGPLRTTSQPASRRGRASKPKGSTAADSQGDGPWDRLIETTEDRLAERPEKPIARSFAPRKPARPSWVLPATATGLILLGFLAVGIFIIKIKSKDGEVVLKDPTPGTRLAIEPDGKVNIVTGGNDGDQVPPIQPTVTKAEPTPPPAVTKAGKTPTPQDATAARVAALDDALNKRIPMRFRRATSLTDLIGYIKEKTRGPNDSGIPIYVDPFGLMEAEKTMDSRFSIDLEGRPLKETLRLALRQLGLAYFASEGLLTISSPAEHGGGESKPVAKVPNDGTPESMAILEALETAIPMNFPGGHPLEEAVDYLKANVKGPGRTALPIFVDPDGLHEAEKSMDSPITLTLEGLPLRITLRLLLRQLGMDYYVKDGLLTITDWGSIPPELK